MELQILVSKKGTQVVTASNLHGALKLPAHKYNSNVEKWLTDVYGFKDDIRKPIAMKDYSIRKKELSKQKDYFISIELAKLITLNSSSGVKQKFAKWLMSLEEKVENAELLTKEQVLTVLELTKVMGLTSCQYSVEKQHLRQYEENKGYAYNWWQYRAALLGYSVNELRGKMLEIGKSYKGKSLRHMLMKIDKYEVIRMAVVDLFVALGKSKAYAKNMGDLAKIFANEMKVEMWDDRKASINFAHNNVNVQLLNEVKAFQKGGYLGLW